MSTFAMKARTTSQLNYWFLMTLFLLGSGIPVTVNGQSGSIAVTITELNEVSGEIGCTLFSTEQGFPMDTVGAITKWAEVRDCNTCMFESLSAGTYALAVSHDRNGNRKTDTNFIGIPKEAWGVSKNVRPRMRAPRFEEAAFELKNGEHLELKIGVKK